MGGPIIETQSWAMFCKDVAQWSLLGHGAWAVTMSENGTFVGQVGVNGHPYFPETELGWLVLPKFARQGIGSEAVLAARRWAFSTLNLASLVSYIHSSNAASIALAKRLGAFLDTDAAPCPYEKHVVYRHLSSEAE
jgi:RimJ/RimL family protein N-acetyltransferase